MSNVKSTKLFFVVYARFLGGRPDVSVFPLRIKQWRKFIASLGLKYYIFPLASYPTASLLFEKKDQGGKAVRSENRTTGIMHVSKPATFDWVVFFFNSLLSGYITCETC